MPRRGRRPDDLVCCQCGSDKVQVLDWVNPNTNQFCGGNEDTEDPSHFFCEECSENPEALVERQYYEKCHKGE